MKFEIKNENDSITTFKKLRIVSKKKTKSYFDFLFIMLVISIIGILLQLIDNNSESKSVIIDSIFYGLFFYVLISIYLFFIGQFKLRRKLIRKYQINQPDYTYYQFFEDKLIVKGTFSEYILKWNYFGPCEIIDNYVVFTEKLDGTPAVIVDIESLSEIERKDLVEFIKTK